MIILLLKVISNLLYVKNGQNSKKKINSGLNKSNIIKKN